MKKILLAGMLVLVSISFFTTEVKAESNKALKPELTANYYLKRGNAFAAKGQYDQAIKDYNKAIQIDPNYEPAYNNRGNAYKEKGKYDEAKKDYKKACLLGNKTACNLKIKK